MCAGLALAATTLAGAPDDVELIVGQSDRMRRHGGPLRGLTRRLRLESLMLMALSPFED
jgi:hypothetical protein